MSSTDTVTLTLPIPPIANTMYRIGTYGAYKKKDVRAYQDEVKLICMSRKLKPLAGPVSLRVDWYRKDKRGDLDGRLKVLLDSLQGFAYVNDSQVEEIHARRIDGDPNPRMVVKISEGNHATA